MKKNDPKKITDNLAREEAATYRISRGTKHLLVKDFLFEDFKKIADAGPFTQAEWAEMLHLSERTLQRYAKENAAFNGLQTERILHLGKFIDMGNGVFGKEGLKNWLGFKPYTLNGLAVRDVLHTYPGIETAINILGRIEHGIPA